MPQRLFSSASFQKRFKPHLPSFSSPKFPQPIFFPTRKLGPTMRTPEVFEEPDGRCPLRFPWLTLVPLVVRSPYFSLCWSMACHSTGQQEPRVTHKKRPPGPGPPQKPQPWLLVAPGWHSRSHGPEAGAVNPRASPTSPSQLDQLLSLDICHTRKVETWREKQLERTG